MKPRAILYGEGLLDCYAEQLDGCSAFDIASACIGVKALRKLEAPLRRAITRGSQGRFLVGLDLPSDPSAIGFLAKLDEESGGGSGCVFSIGAIPRRSMRNSPSSG